MQNHARRAVGESIALVICYCVKFINFSELVYDCICAVLRTHEAGVTGRENLVSSSSRKSVIFMAKNTIYI